MDYIVERVCSRNSLSSISEGSDYYILYNTLFDKYYMRKDCVTHCINDCVNDCVRCCVTAFVIHAHDSLLPRDSLPSLCRSITRRVVVLVMDWMCGYRIRGNWGFERRGLKLYLTLEAGINANAGFGLDIEVWG
jgi:hypothetical protein